MGSTDTPARRQSRNFYASTPALLDYENSYLKARWPIETSTINATISSTHNEVIEEESFNDSSQNISNLEQSIFEETISQSTDLRHRRRGFYISREWMENSRNEDSLEDTINNNETEKTIVQEDFEETFEELPAVKTVDKHFKNPIFSQDLSEKFSKLRQQFSQRWKILENRSVEKIANFADDGENPDKDDKQHVESPSSQKDLPQDKLVEKRQRTPVKSERRALGAVPKRAKDKNKMVKKEVCNLEMEEDPFDFSLFSATDDLSVEKFRKLREKRKRHSELDHHQKKQRVSLRLPESDDESLDSPEEKKFRRIKNQRRKTTDTDAGSSNSIVNISKGQQQSTSLISKETKHDFAVKKSKDRRRKKSSFSESTSTDDESFDGRKKSGKKMMRQNSQASLSQVDDSSGKIPVVYRFFTSQRQQELNISIDLTVDSHGSIRSRWPKCKSKRRW